MILREACPLVLDGKLVARGGRISIASYDIFSFIQHLNRDWKSDIYYIGENDV